MLNPGFLVFLVVTLLLLVTGLLLASELLARPAKLFERAFPATRPRLNLFGPPNQEESDALVIYVSARLFAVCLLYLVSIWLVGLIGRA